MLIYDGLHYDALAVRLLILKHFLAKSDYCVLYPWTTRLKVFFEGLSA